MELRKDDEKRMSQFTTTFREELSAFRRGEEKGFAELGRTIAGLKPETVKTDPAINFWTIYKKVADEYDDDMVSKYVGNLDTSLLFAGLFSAVTTAFIIQIIPELQPNPVDLTNVLLLRILQQNTSFGGADPLASIPNTPVGVIRAQAILFASLSITMFVAFIAVLGKQWVLYYTRVTTWGNIVDRGKERQEKLAGLKKWGLHLIMESLPVMLQFALLLFGVALAVYLWDLDVVVAEGVLVVTSVGLAFYILITVAAMIWKDCPFQTPVSVILPKVLPSTKELIAFARVWLRHWLRRRVTKLVRRLTERGRLASSLGHVFKLSAGGATIPNPAGEDTVNNDYPMTLSNPAFWRHEPLFTSPIHKDIAASAGFWLLENSTDFSAVTAVAAVFSELQWPSHHRSTTALIRLRDTFIECFRASEFCRNSRLKALQSAAAYYVLYHTQLIWTTSKCLAVEKEKLPRDLPTDLFLHKYKWDEGVFERLLRIEDRSEPVTSARFLSYIAPYWFFGDSDATIRSRPSRLQTLNEHIEVLEKSRALTLASLTDCILCVGAAMDFPLHPEDLIRVDKSDYLADTFKLVVEHIHGIVLAKGRRRRHTKTALEILLNLAKKTTFPLVEAAWINDLLETASGGEMDDETFVVLLRFSALRKEEDVAADSETLSGQGHNPTQRDEVDPRPTGETVTPEQPAPEYALLSQVLQNVKTCGAQEGGWQDEAVYDGLIAIRDIPELRLCPPKAEFLQTLFKAIEKGENKGEGQGQTGEENKKEKPFRVRKAAYDVVLAARDGWLRSADLRQTLEELDFPRKLHSVVIETSRSDHQRSFLGMMEILSEDGYWHSYLRKSMDIWLPLHHEGPIHALRILATVGGLLLPGLDGYNGDKSIEEVVEEEWAAVPGRLPMDLTADRLGPLAEVTKQVKELLFIGSEWRVVLAVVKRVIPSLENRRDDGYVGPGEDIRNIVNDLLEKLREPS